MANITLSVPDAIHEIMKKHEEIRWSTIAKVAIIKHVKKLALLDKIASKSKLTIKDIEDINAKIKKGLRQEIDG